MSRMVIPPALLGRHHRPGEPHVESWFMKANAPDGSRAFWTRCTILSAPPLPTVAEAWAIAFDRERGHLAVKSTVDCATARFAADGIDVEVDGCFLSSARAKGALASGRGTVSWDLSLSKSIAAPILHLPAPVLYRRGVPPATKALTAVSDARAEGTIHLARSHLARSHLARSDLAPAAAAADVWDVAGWPMMIGHNWGKHHPELYAWTHCNSFDVEGLVFEAVSARVRVGPLLSPMATTAFVRWRGRAWDLSGLRALAVNRGGISLRRWELASVGGPGKVAIDAEVAAPTDDFVGLHYANPSGPPLYCLNAKLARARLELVLPDGETISARSNAAALELGTMEPDHGVRMYL